MSERLVVDANELKDWIKKEVHVKDLSDGAGLCNVIFADDFERAMSRFPGKAVAFQEVKHGKWIADDSGYGDDFYTCSVCKDGCVLEAGTPKENNMRYCPYCGAKMDSEE